MSKPAMSLDTVVVFMLELSELHVSKYDDVTKSFYFDLRPRWGRP
jgi:hypothetical protein